MHRLRVISFGLGPIGAEIARVAASKSEFEVVSAVDIDQAKVGHSLREVAGADSDVLVVATLEEALEGREADALLHSTTSSLQEVQDQIVGAVGKGLDVVSTCEELAYPWRTQAGLARKIDEEARANGARVLGTGVNPGFVMDILPLVVTSACQHVNRLEIERVVDAGGRRIPLQRKVGAGLSVEEFDRLVTAGTVRHVGLAESAWMVLEGLGWEADDWQETLSPVIAQREISTGIGTVLPGRVAGVRQTLRVSSGGVERLHMELRIYVGAGSPMDRVSVSGVPDLDVTITGGVHGDRATAAMVVNSMRALPEARSGVLTMLDLLRVHGR